MISRNIFSDLLLMILFIILQIYVFNRIPIFGDYNAVIYPIFVLFYPFYRNPYYFLIASFLLGLGIDAFLSTWGINALATTSIAYFRSFIFKRATDREDEYYTFQSLQWSQFIGYIFLSLLIHQLLVQFLEYFRFDQFLEVSLNVLITSLTSTVFIIIYALIFKIKEKI